MSAFGVRTVVFPTDFSNCSRHAGETAAAIARQLGAHVHVVHVDPPVTEPAAASRLARALTGLGDGFKTTTITLSGIPARQISAYARRVGADLIVIGTHGRTGVSRALLGSVAEAVVRHAPCPVLTVPMAGREPHTAELADVETRHCVACARASTDLICEACRTIIRAQGVESRPAEDGAATSDVAVARRNPD